MKLYNCWRSVRWATFESTRQSTQAQTYYKRFQLQPGTVRIPQHKSPGNAGESVVFDTNIYRVKSKNIQVYRYNVNMTGLTRASSAAPEGRQIQLTKPGQES